MEPDDLRKIEALAENKGRYRPEAYFWVLRAVDFTRKRLRRDKHVSGKELLEGGKELALREYGPMAFEVFRHWGLVDTEDVGRIVFDLIEAEFLEKTEQDTIEDFKGVFDFQRTFQQDYHW